LTQKTASSNINIREGDVEEVVRLLAIMGWSNGKIQERIKLDNTLLRKIANEARGQTSF
jgi:hypothetical protein